VFRRGEARPDASVDDLEMVVRKHRTETKVMKQQIIMELRLSREVVVITLCCAAVRLLRN
jgi:hypothetical protein